VKNRILNRDRQSCFVCGVRFKTSIPAGPANVEEHHVMPRNAGGTDGPLVRLCDSHHTLLHKVAERLHRKAVFTDLMVGEQPSSIPKIMWLAAAVVRSEKAVENDPNKHVQNSVRLSQEDLHMLKRLQGIYKGKGRSELLRAGLFLLYRRHFND